MIVLEPDEPDLDMAGRDIGPIEPDFDPWEDPDEEDPVEEVPLRRAA